MKLVYRSFQLLLILGRAREDGLLLTYVILVWLDLIGICLLFTVFIYSPDDIHPNDRKACGLTEDWDWWRGTLIFLCSTFIANLGGPFFALCRCFTSATWSEIDNTWFMKNVLPSRRQWNDHLHSDPRGRPPFHRGLGAHLDQHAPLVLALRLLAFPRGVLDLLCLATGSALQGRAEKSIDQRGGKEKNRG